MYLLAIFLTAIFASELKNYSPKCKWGKYLVIDIKYPCPDPYKACNFELELLKGCKKFDEQMMKICCVPKETTTLNLIESVTTAVTTTTAEPEEGNMERSESSDS